MNPTAGTSAVLPGSFASVSYTHRDVYKRQQLEDVYGKNGLTLTDAVNVFFQQSLNAGGFPFEVNENNAEIIKAKAIARLMKELKAAQEDATIHSEEEVYAMFGVEK